MGLKEDFDAITLETIKAYVVEKCVEDLHLDFKLVSDPKLTRDDRKIFAKALSGFANSDGGLVVWGVDARKNSDGLDCASELKPVCNAPLLHAKLNEFTGSAVSPIVDHIQHRAIVETETAGFCVTYVPPSDSGPHMAKHGEDRYYKRAGALFYKMEHFDLEDMFGRRQRPVLKLSASVTQSTHFTSEEEVRFFLVNEGRAAARHAGFSCKFLPNVLISTAWDGLADCTKVNAGSPIVSYQNHVGVIHPNGISSPCGGVRLRCIAPGPLAVTYKLYCEHMRMDEGVLEIAAKL